MGNSQVRASSRVFIVAQACHALMFGLLVVLAFVSPELKAIYLEPGVEVTDDLATSLAAIGIIAV